MDVTAKNQSYRAIPRPLATFLLEYSRAQGKRVEWDEPDTSQLPDVGQPASHRLVLMGKKITLEMPFQPGPLPWESALGIIGEHTSVLLESLGATVTTRGGGTTGGGLTEHRVDTVICLRMGQHTSTLVRGVQARICGPFLGSRHLAVRLLEQIGMRTGIPSRGIRLWPVSPPRDIPRAINAGVSLECGCVTCPADVDLLVDPGVQIRFACALAEAVLYFFGFPGEELLAHIGETVDHNRPSLSKDVGDFEPVLEPVPVPEATAVLEVMPEESPATLSEVTADQVPTPDSTDLFSLALLLTQYLTERLDGSLGPIQEPVLSAEPGPKAPEQVHPAADPIVPDSPPVTQPDPTARQEVQPMKRKVPRKRGPGIPPNAHSLVPRGVNGTMPDPMLPGPDGSWISRKAYQMLQRQQVAEAVVPPGVPRVTTDGRIQWPGLPPGWISPRG